MTAAPCMAHFARSIDSFALHFPCRVQDVFNAIMHQYTTQCNNSMVLQIILDAFDPFFYAKDVAPMVRVNAAVRICMH